MEQYLEECLVSVMKQTLKDIEIICVNDGSTDNSLHILQELQRQDSRIEIISKENSGYGHSVNLGIDQAKGKYIAIVESDDYVDIHMLEDLFAIAEEDQLDVVKADCRKFIINENGKQFTYTKALRGDDSKFYNTLLTYDDINAKFNGYVYTWAGIYNKNFLNDYEIRHNETPGASYQDNGFWFQTMMYARRLRYIPNAYYNLRRDNPNSSYFSKDKVFCISDEYDFIYRKIGRANLMYKDTLFRVCFYKRFLNYIWTMKRIRPEYFREFYLRMKQDFHIALLKGEIDATMFQSQQWMYLYHVIHADEPIMYHKNEIISLHAVKRINKSNNVYIYGAGAFGKKVYEILTKAGFEDKIKNFIVTESNKDEIHVFGISVITLSNEMIKEDDLVIIAVGNKYVEEIKRHLQNKGLSNVIEIEDVITQ